MQGDMSPARYAISPEIIVEKHEGAIEVDSQVGEGTIFTILLPIAT